MATISSTGVGSGLDVNSIITQLMAVEQLPLKQLQTDASGINTQISSVGQIQSLTTTMGNKADAINSLTLWRGVTNSSTDTSSVTADTSAGGATPGTYSVNVTNLAQSQTATSGAFTSSASTLNEGTLTIQLGSWDRTATPPSFAGKSGSSAVTINIGAGETSLASIRDKINGAGAGVQASIITDANGARLSIRSSDTGKENGFKITANETTDDGTAGTGLSALVYDPSTAGASQLGLNQDALNAKATVNGIAIESASNTLTGVSDGLNLTLVKATTSPVTVTISQDTDSIKKAITDWVSSYNSLSNYIKDQTKYDATTKKGGPLQGDPSIVGFQSQMRSMLNQNSTASSTYARLSDIGITIQSDGTLATDSTKLGTALGNLTELKKVLTATADTSAGQGFMVRFGSLADAANTTDGRLDSRETGLKAELDRNSKQQDQMQTRLDATQTRLQAQYQALDTQMAKLNALSSYVSQQMAMLAKN